MRPPEVDAVVVSVVDVVDLFVDVRPGAEPAALFLHEGAGAGVVWDKLIPDLVRDRQAVSYDRRGYGKSPRDVALNEQHFDQAADDLVDVIRQYAMPPVDLVGHSDGGSVGLLAASRHPSLVRSIVVVATHVFADPATTDAVRALGPPDRWDARTQSRYERLHGSDWACVVSGWLRLWAGGLSQWDIRARLPQITSPVLVVHDIADPLSPRIHADQIQSLVPHCRVRWYDTGSHRPHMVDQRGFTDEVRTFWRALG